MNLNVIDEMNYMGKEKIPFLFVFDFLSNYTFAIKLSDINPDELLFSLNGISNSEAVTISKKLLFDVEPVSRLRYNEAYKTVEQHINYGDTFLLNLTMPSKIKTNYSLKEIFYSSKAKYKLWLKDKFVVFSPEIFIKTDGNKISSFPMKGTIDAKLFDAEKKLLSSEKELAEHFTIVDLIRNDLSMVSKKVIVEKFRQIEKIKTNKGELLQMSSKISGKLPDNWQSEIGNMISKMLPAGSISGAPKKKTIEIINEVEKYERGFYTGIFGIFDGKNIDSGVMIRFIEQTKDGLIYKSGGGITSKSNMDEEYTELIQKIYVPL